MRGKVILLDECSMIDAKTANDLLQSGARIIAVGDPGQLPPVHGAQFFNHADVLLKTIHRQALDSAVLRQAHSMRETGTYQADGDDFQIVHKASDEQMMAADAILCWRNVTRHKINARMRNLFGFHMPYPMAGETVLCLKNSHQHGIFNGVTYELSQAFQPDDTAINLLIDGVEVEVPKCVFVEKGGCLDDYDDDDFVSAFDYGYCLTAHKAQGSEWNKVLLVDEITSMSGAGGSTRVPPEPPRASSFRLNGMGGHCPPTPLSQSLGQLGYTLAQANLFRHVHHGTTGSVNDPQHLRVIRQFACPRTVPELTQGRLPDLAPCLLEWCGLLPHILRRFDLPTDRRQTVRLHLQLPLAFPLPIAAGEVDQVIA